MSYGMIAVGAGAVGSALIGANASSKAAGAQANAANQANATQAAQYNQTRQDQLPWTTAGGNALTQLQAQLGQTSGGYFDSAAYLAANPDVAAQPYWAADPYQHYLQYGQREGRNAPMKGVVTADMPGFGALNTPFTGKDLQNEPGYQFGLSEGMRGLNNSAAARGGVLSGAALKAASRYNTDYASTKYNEAFNRDNTTKTNTFNRLASIAGVGQTATNQVAAAGANMANNVSQNQLSAGNARASGYVGGANAISGAIGQGWNMYQGNQLLNALGSRNSAGGGLGFGDTSAYTNYAPTAVANGGWGIE